LLQAQPVASIYVAIMKVMSEFSFETRNSMQATSETSTGSRLSFWRLSISLIATVLMLLSASLYGHAQNEHHYTVEGGAGYSPLVGDISSRLDNGWHVTVGGGFNFTSHFATTLDYTYNGYGVTRRVLTEANVPGGNAHMWSITLNPRLRLNPKGKLDPYVVGGVGYYRRTIEFTRPVLVSVFIFDPFFGGFFNTLVQSNQVIGDITRGGVGGSLGAGFDVKLPRTGAKVFAEARYHYAATGRIVTRMIPVTVGVRW
jgi:opacity protein-like surface antigen